MKHFKVGILLIMIMPVVLALFVLNITCNSSQNSQELDVSFSGKRGQVEVGSHFVGAEFHHSRPVPSRFSFYYPVANSLDISKGYWERSESLPLLIEWTINGKIDTIGLSPAVYSYNPYHVTFTDTIKDHQIEFHYDFTDNLPVVVLSIRIYPLSDNATDSEIAINLNPTIRTSHSFKTKLPSRITTNTKHTIAMAYFNETDTDSVVLVLASALDNDVNILNEIPVNIDENNNNLRITGKSHKKGNSAEYVFLIGICRQSEKENVLAKTITHWEKQVKQLDHKIRDYAFNQMSFHVPGNEFLQTFYWSKAMVASLQHYIDEKYLPMPCPAEYNFFFTHDLLLTGLGVMNYDLDFVKNGYDFLLSKTESDSILPHAYYWKDDHYVIEPCNPDNWNNLWIIISASKYLKHSDDKKTVRMLYPIMTKSIQTMLKNLGPDNLMYANRPDWWDIGDRYGARAYITILTIRALEDFEFISMQLGENISAKQYSKLIPAMKKGLVTKLWDKDKDFLLNYIDEIQIDQHYYTGSLMACVFNTLEQDKKYKILKTASEQLLDTQLGIRNAWPPDFHNLIDVYKFNGMEAGKPYFYFNAGIWSHNNAWYALALIESAMMDKACSFVKKYMTLDGIQNSPNGQPSFYEYRFTDPKSPDYGVIDKPTFLWAAGWYIDVMYQLAGMRNNAWSLFFSPRLPKSFDAVSYDIMLQGKKCHIQYRGTGDFFKNIKVDGKNSYSALVWDSVQNIQFERGKPEYPYLAMAEAVVSNVDLSKAARQLIINFDVSIERDVLLEIVSPWNLLHVKINDKTIENIQATETETGIYVYKINHVYNKTKNKCVFQFQL